MRRVKREFEIVEEFDSNANISFFYVWEISHWRTWWRDFWEMDDLVFREKMINVGCSCSLKEIQEKLKKHLNPSQRISKRILTLDENGDNKLSAFE